MGQELASCPTKSFPYTIAEASVRKSANPYQLYSDFLEKSTLLNKVLYTIHSRWNTLGIPALPEDYEHANRLSHIIMFLSQIMAFEAFLARCLRDECGLTPRQIKDMRNIEVRIRCLLPGIDRDAGLSDDVKRVRWAFDLRDTWMHGCGDPSLTIRGGRARGDTREEAAPRDVLDHKLWEWIDGDVWSETGALLPKIAGRIAERFGWKTDT